MNRIKGSFAKKFIFIFFLYAVFCPGALFAFEETITVPAESPEGVTVDLEKGEYVVEIAGGAITLFYPINPNYCWLIGVLVGTDVEGGQSEANIGKLYFDPASYVYSQSALEQEALEATEQRLGGTYLEFSLDEDKEVRFWVSDYDYSDNSGMVKLKIRSISDLK